LERSLSETDRARGIFELAIAQPALDMPELLWKVHNLFLVKENVWTLAFNCLASFLIRHRDLFKFWTWMEREIMKIGG